MKSSRYNEIYIEHPEKVIYKADEFVEICSEFGCDKKLTLEEKLCGTKCTGHQGSKKIDVVKFLKFK